MAEGIHFDGSKANRMRSPRCERKGSKQVQVPALKCFYSKKAIFKWRHFIWTRQKWRKMQVSPSQKLSLSLHAKTPCNHRNDDRTTKHPLASIALGKLHQFASIAFCKNFCFFSPTQSLKGTMNFRLSSLKGGWALVPGSHPFRELPLQEVKRAILSLVAWHFCRTGTAFITWLTLLPPFLRFYRSTQKCKNIMNIQTKKHAKTN